ncbi:MAG: pyruvate carboxylase [Pseudomonadota bacterium]
MPHHAFKRLLIANRGEIAIRVMRAANELGIATAAVYAQEDRLALHRFKADASYLIGEDLGPVRAYLSIEEMLRVAREARADAVHPGYGFLSENPDFAEACAVEGLVFIGPKPETMRLLGNKVSARDAAQKADVPVVPATGPLPDDLDQALAEVEAIGFPVMLKASWGGGGRGMRAVHEASALGDELLAAKREAEAAFGNGEVYAEKLIARARHVEVQLLGDSHGNIVHLFERDCSVQRRNQKIVERAPAPYFDESQRDALCQAALRLGRHAGYANAGTVEFLLDADTDDFYFIEVNPRIQVEHTVTEEVTGIDIVKAQIRIAQGAAIGTPDSGVPAQEDIHLNGHALQCRITTEDPEANFIPDYGRITAYRGATGFGIRLDGGTAYSGAVITRYYDSLLEKVTAWAPTSDEAIARMDRALREFRIRGVATNLAFVENLINHPSFRDNSYTTRFIDTTPELFHFARRRDRATKLLRFIAEVTVNGNPEVANRPLPVAGPSPKVPKSDKSQPPAGTRQRLDEHGPKAFADWMLAQKNVLVTDTTMRDAHQSLIATRMRSYDMAQVAGAYAREFPDLLSLECWGGATFDVAMRFLDECPWDRLAALREAIPNICFQMLLRGANGVGYTNYPDNVVRHFVAQAATSGVDIFRVFDSLNWVENMRVSMDAVLESGRLLEAAICYTGDMLDPARNSTYDLKYYVKLARDLADAGSHVLGIKDMAGVVKPEAARVLVKALKEETGLPVHFHTHDTSGVAAASVLAAVDAGVDAIDLAMDSWSGLTSQPNLGSVVAALRHGARDPGLDPATIRAFSDYWEAVRRDYRAFESDLRFGASEVYLHEMPGGQFTNLKEQARSLGLEARWHDVARAYAEVNLMFGDIVKVTPTSKVVGDMALAMVSAGWTREDIEDPDHDIAFPESVVQLFRGDIGQPPNGFPEALQKKILKGAEPLTTRPGAVLQPADLDAERADAEHKVERHISDEEFCSYLMYPRVFTDYAARRRDHGPVHVLPTPIFLYGMTPGQEIAVDIEHGKTLVIRFQTIGETDDDGNVRVFFDLNGQPRIVRVANRAVADKVVRHKKAEDGNRDHVPAPMPGMVASVAVKAGQQVASGDLLLTIEAMKMETAIHAQRDGTIGEVAAPVGTQVDAKDLLIAYQSNG